MTTLHTRFGPGVETDRGLDFGESQQQQQQQQGRQRRINVGENERVVSVAAGAILALQGLSRGSIPGLLTAAVGGMLVYRGITGQCGICEKLGLDTARAGDEMEDYGISESGIHVEQSMLINKPAEELYRYWRDFNNLPAIMTHLISVQVRDDQHSHWVAKAPAIAGGQVEWDAEITADEPNTLIGWRSLPGSQVEHIGQIRFEKAMGDRGTNVHVFMDYVPPAGKLGHWVATLFGEAPGRQMRDDLRNFKRVMETGEILTTIGQPRGTCTGEGKIQETL
jgi:uncharacterized membrane protein